MDKLTPVPLEQCGPGRVSWCNTERTAELVGLLGGMVFCPAHTLARSGATLVRVPDPKHSFIDYLIANEYRAPERFTMGNNIRRGQHCSIGGEGFGFHNGRRFPHLGSITIGDDVEIGSNVCIDRGALGDTIIGARTKIDNLVHIAHNAVIGEDCLIVAQSGIGGSAVIGNGVFIGFGAKIKNKVRIGDGAIIGMGAVVICDVPTGETWAGIPARKLKEAPHASED